MGGWTFTWSSAGKVQACQSSGVAKWGQETRDQSTSSPFASTADYLMFETNATASTAGTYPVLDQNLAVSKKLQSVKQQLQQQQQQNHAPPKEGVTWEDFNFSLNGVKTDAMWVDKVVVGKESFSADSSRSLQPMGTLQLSPAATVLNYGQALFEGMKAIRRQDGTIALFRPEMNALRMKQGAERFLLPTVPTDVFVTAAEQTVRANAQWVPPPGKGAFYLNLRLPQTTPC
eukprot:scaffold2804_cov181-Amphora_coffeaeformis.AAC.13